MIKEDIIKILNENKGKYLSGEILAGDFKVTRSYISQIMKELKKSGFIISASTRKGYCFEGVGNDLNEDIMYYQLLNQKFINKVIYFDTLPSTNQYIKDNVDEMNGNTLVVAGKQTEGRGRRGRSFVSDENGLYFSIFLRSRIDIAETPFITSVAAAAVLDSVLKVGAAAEVKWPNDILCHGKKVCGILTEMSSDPEQTYYIIVGIGINLYNESFPDEISDIATSLKMEGIEVNKTDFLFNVIKNFSTYYGEYENGNKKAILTRLKKYSCIIGKTVKFNYGGEVLTAKAVDLNENGNLTVENDKYGKLSLNSGEISLFKEGRRD